jgi:hypothetical protein
MDAVAADQQVEASVRPSLNVASICSPESSNASTVVPIRRSMPSPQARPRISISAAWVVQ